ncbi:hypothetical protein DW757_03630 [Clostridium sp. AM29-11AC]|uniref:DUF6602 domain-containing protein n=1 Tax=Clostridium sp. AM29-11AC TaxID=2293028 RepID=UPI000E53073F|nr:DUF6602 domain-containing protein [Clostridium sp. AM29-11AC]RHT58691.1 hypothetical protein DW757_03630 [Clostridium sp. AM29-11AC]
MDGTRIRTFVENEAEAMLKTYRQFQVLIPADGREGAAHTGEDGMYVEALLKSYIQKFLPAGLEVMTGFILRPAVKTGSGKKERAGDRDAHSSQLDLIIFDSASYPVFLRMGDHAIVPPEGVIGVISVKKNLYFSQLEQEINALKQAGRLCTGKNALDQEVKGPFLALAAMDTKESDTAARQGEKVFASLDRIFCQEGKNRYDWFPGYIGVLSRWSVCKSGPKREQPGKKTKKQADYFLFEHREHENYLGFQKIIAGLLSVYYDRTRGNEKRLGFEYFASGRGYDKKLGSIPYVKEHGDLNMEKKKKL